MDALKILVLCYEYPPIGGGGGVGVQQYAEAWAAAGHTVRVLTSRATDLAARETVGGVDVVRVSALGRRDRATSTFLAMFWYLATGALQLVRERRDYAQFEVINTHFSIPTGPLGWFASRLLGIPDVLTIIGGDIYDPSKRSSPHNSALMRRLNHWLIESAARVIAISTDTKTRAELYHGVTRDVRVINYGFKPCPPSAGDNGAEERPARGAYQLISVGRLVSRKGFDHLVRAMKELPEDVGLWIVGDGPLAAELEELARSEGVEKRVSLLGYRTREQIHALLREADCYVLSSLHEGLGIVVQEAMEAGLPVVATDNGGQVDLIHPDRNGLLVPVADPSALAAAVSELSSDPERGRSMGRNNQQDIDELHIDRNCTLYIDEFELARSEAGR